MSEQRASPRCRLEARQGDPGGNKGVSGSAPGYPAHPAASMSTPKTAALSGSPDIGSSGRRDGGPVLLGQPEGSPSGAQRANAASPYPQNWLSHPASEVAHIRCGLWG